MPGQKTNNKLKPAQTLKSVLASMFGVQSQASAEQDFKHGKAPSYIMLGVTVVILLVIALYCVVQLVLP